MSRYFITFSNVKKIRVLQEHKNLYRRKYFATNVKSMRKLASVTMLCESTV